MKRGILTRLIILLAGAALLPGCSRPAPYKNLVVFSQCNNAEPYRAAQNAEMKKLWSQQPDVRLVMMDAQQDSVRQIAQIETAIRMKPQLLIVAPNEAAPLTEVMKRAMNAGIAVICLERNISQPYYTTWISADNRAIGGLIGQYVADFLSKKNGGQPAGNVVELAGLKGVAAERERKDGAHDVWKKYPGIKVLTEAVANWSQSLARDRMTEILSALPHIDVVYGRNDPMAMGAYLAARELGREREMIFVGIDGLPGESGGVSEVRKGFLSATCVYPLCVDQAVAIGAKILRDSTYHPDKVVLVASQLITPQSVGPDGSNTHP